MLVVHRMASAVVMVQKRLGPVCAGRPTGHHETFNEDVEQQRSGSSVYQARLNSTTDSDAHSLIMINLAVAGCVRPLRTLLDSGATNNFDPSAVIEKTPSMKVAEFPDIEMVVRLAGGKSVRTPKRVMRLQYGFDSFQVENVFLAIDMDDKLDVILGMLWPPRHRPVID